MVESRDRRPGEGMLHQREGLIQRFTAQATVMDEDVNIAESLR